MFDRFGIGGDVENEEEIDEGMGEDPERLRLREDGDVVKKIKDPRLPSEDEVKEHFEMGHAIFRDWCGICV
eukprot:10956552-Karenia_brevis.AAC.1